MKFLMNLKTGSVDTYENWKDDAKRDYWDFDDELGKNLVEVVKDQLGNWIEA